MYELGKSMCKCNVRNYTKIYCILAYYESLG